MAKYISVTETAKIIRKELKTAFPGITFSVRSSSYSMGASIRVEWTDGPTTKQVETVTRVFVGSTFDAMQDLKSYVDTTWNGEAVHFGSDYVNCSRKYSDGFLRPIAEACAKEWDQPVPKIHISDYDGSASVWRDRGDTPICGRHTIPDIIDNKAYDTPASIPTTLKADKAEGLLAETITHKGEAGWKVYGNTWPHKEIIREFKPRCWWVKAEKFWFFPESAFPSLPDEIQELVEGSEDAKLKPPTEPKPVKSPAAYFRELADKMEDQIQAKLHPATANQRPTRRRVSIIESMRQDARNLQKRQSALRGLADVWDSDTVPATLVGVDSRKHIDTLIGCPSVPAHDQKILKSLARANIHASNYNQARTDLLALCDQTIGKETEADKIRKAEAELIGQKIPGYFPTPKTIVERMKTLAIMSNATGMRILEPSAGKGNIADVLRQKFPKAAIHCVEPNHSLRKVLKLKGYELVDDDILRYTPEQKYDYAIMNPPFEKFQDIDHVRHVYEYCMKPGGRMVSIMSESVFFRSDKKAVEFRDWLDSVNASIFDLPAGAFNSSERPTGVKTRIVSIFKREVPTDTLISEKSVSQPASEPLPTTSFPYTPVEIAEEQDSENVSEPIPQPVTASTENIDTTKEAVSELRKLESEAVDLVQQILSLQRQLQSKKDAIRLAKETIAEMGA